MVSKLSDPCSFGLRIKLLIIFFVSVSSYPSKVFSLYGRSGGLAVLWRLRLNLFLRIILTPRLLKEIIVLASRVTTSYGYPKRARCRDSWQMIRTLASTSDLPWGILGDFNDMVGLKDKKRVAEHPGIFFVASVTLLMNVF